MVIARTWALHTPGLESREAKRDFVVKVLVIVILKGMRRLTLQEAKIQVARLYMAQEEARKAWADAGGTQQASSVCTDEMDQEVQIRDSKAEEDAKKIWESRNSARKRLLCQLATDPELRKHMSSCSVWFCGSQEPAWFTEGRQPNDTEFKQTLKSDDSSLSRKVKDWIHSKGYHISGSGGGCGGWDMDVCGSYEELAKLCDMAHEELREYLDADILTLSFKLYEFSFKNFTHDDMVKFLEN